MGISVRVRTYTGTVEGTCAHHALDALCERATSRSFPMLGCVDPHDDTAFNRAQLRLVVPELQALAEDSPKAEAEAAQEILALTALLTASPTGTFNSSETDGHGPSALTFGVFPPHAE
jgi:hypothetical protein